MIASPTIVSPTIASPTIASPTIVPPTLAIGEAVAAGGAGGGGVGRRHPFVFHLCPVPDLDAMLASHRGHLPPIRDEDDRDDGDDGGGGGGASTTTATSRAVASHAWLNARLTDAFTSSDRRRGGGGGDDDGGNEVGHHGPGPDVRGRRRRGEAARGRRGSDAA
jgi:hypothetical protein